MIANDNLAVTGRQWSRMEYKIKSPWVVASGIAVACMLVDELPGGFHNSLSDPGAAAMLSIILADIVTALGRRRWTGRTHLVLWVGLILKFFIQPLFWVQNAWFWDIGTLLLTHAILAFFVIRKAPFARRLVSFFAAIAYVSFSLAILAVVTAINSSWVGFFVQLWAARVLIPLAFWTAIITVERMVKERPREPAGPLNLAA